MITITGIVELMDSNSQPIVDIRHKCNNYWDDAIKETKSVFEFDFDVFVQNIFINKGIMVFAQLMKDIHFGILQVLC